MQPMRDLLNFYPSRILIFVTYSLNPQLLFKERLVAKFKEKTTCLDLIKNKWVPVLEAMDHAVGFSTSLHNMITFFLNTLGIEHNLTDRKIFDKIYSLSNRSQSAQLKKNNQDSLTESCQKLNIEVEGMVDYIILSTRNSAITEPEEIEFAIKALKKVLKSKQKILRQIRACFVEEEVKISTLVSQNSTGNLDLDNVNGKKKNDIVVVSQKLAGMVFCMSGTFTMSQHDTKVSLIQNGAKCIQNFSDSVTHVLCGADALKFPTAKLLKAAKKKDIVFVTENWLHHALEGNIESCYEVNLSEILNNVK